jgi:hypothetical protein
MSGHWHYVDGLLAESTIDNGDGTGTHTTYNADGSVAQVEQITGLQVVQQYPPLDSTGALATLLVVVGALDIEDAANAIHEEPEHLEHEALAWSL